MRAPSSWSVASSILRVTSVVDEIRAASQCLWHEQASENRARETHASRVTGTCVTPTSEQAPCSRALAEPIAHSQSQARARDGRRKLRRTGFWVWKKVKGNEQADWAALKGSSLVELLEKDRPHPSCAPRNEHHGASVLHRAAWPIVALSQRHNVQASCRLTETRAVLMSLIW